MVFKSITNRLDEMEKGKCKKPLKPTVYMEGVDGIKREYTSAEGLDIVLARYRAAMAKDNHAQYTNDEDNVNII